MNNQMEPYFLVYTHVDGGGRQSGWQLLNSDAPAAMQRLYEQSARANQYDNNVPIRDGKALCAWKIIAGGNMVGQCYVQYGLSDSGGRLYFYSSGLVFENAYEVLKNPSVMLSLPKERYNLPEQPSIASSETPVFSPNRKSVSETLTFEIRRRLILAVFHELTNGAHTPLYLVTDGEDDTAKWLLTLIYNALPYSMRPSVSATSYEQAGGKNSTFIFTDERPQYGRFFNVDTGACSITDPDLNAVEQRYGFLHAVIEKPEQANAIYRKVEGKLSSLTGEPEKATPDMVRFVWRFFWKSQNDVAEHNISELLDGLLEYGKTDNAVCAAALYIDSAGQKGWKLTDEVTQRIWNYDAPEQVNSLKISNAYLKYLANVPDYATLKPILRELYENDRENVVVPDEMKARRLSYRELCARLIVTGRGNFVEKFLIDYMRDTWSSQEQLNKSRIPEFDKYLQHYKKLHDYCVRSISVDICFKKVEDGIYRVCVEKLCRQLKEKFTSSCENNILSRLVDNIMAQTKDTTLKETYGLSLREELHKKIHELITSDFHEEFLDAYTEYFDSRNEPYPNIVKLYLAMRDGNLDEAEAVFSEIKPSLSTETQQTIETRLMKLQQTLCEEPKDAAMPPKLKDKFAFKVLSLRQLSGELRKVFGRLSSRLKPHDSLKVPKFSEPSVAPDQPEPPEMNGIANISIPSVSAQKPMKSPKSPKSKKPSELSESETSHELPKEKLP